MIECPSCDNTGYEKLETPTGGMCDHLCTCGIGYALSQPFIGPQPATSAWLYDNEMDKRRAAMRAEGRWECWICDHTWHEDGEACPIASKPSGWIAPEYRKGETA